MDIGDVDNFGLSKGGWEINVCYIKFEAAGGNSLGHANMSKILTSARGGHLARGLGLIARRRSGGARQPTPFTPGGSDA